MGDLELSFDKYIGPARRGLVAMSDLRSIKAEQSSWKLSADGKGDIGCYLIFTGGLKVQEAFTVLNSSCRGAVGWDPGADPHLPRGEI